MGHPDQSEYGRIPNEATIALRSAIACRASLSRIPGLGEAPHTRTFGLCSCSALRNADLRLGVTSIQTLRKTHIPMKYTQGPIRTRRANLCSSPEKQEQAIPVSSDRQGPVLSEISFTIQVFVDQKVNPTVPTPGDTMTPRMEYGLPYSTSGFPHARSDVSKATSDARGLSVMPVNLEPSLTQGRYRAPVPSAAARDGLIRAGESGKGMESTRRDRPRSCTRQRIRNHPGSSSTTSNSLTEGD
jgi:hypothetical protein